MQRYQRVVGAVAFALAGLLGPSRDAQASGAKIEWASIDVPARGDSVRVQKALKQALLKAARKADFGKGKAVKLAARIVELREEQQGDIFRVSCTLAGRLVGGDGARSRISYGGRPEDRRKLEDEVLTQVAQGLVLRLAQISRVAARKNATAPPAAKKAKR